MTRSAWLFAACAAAAPFAAAQLVIPTSQAVEVLEGLQEKENFGAAVLGPGPIVSAPFFNLVDESFFFPDVGRIVRYGEVLRLGPLRQRMGARMIRVDDDRIAVSFQPQSGQAVRFHVLDLDSGVTTLVAPSGEPVLRPGTQEGASFAAAGLEGEEPLLLVGVLDLSEVRAYGLKSGRETLRLSINHPRGLGQIDDLDGDGVPEIAVGTATGSLHISSGADGSQISTFALPEGASFGEPILPLHDLTGDGVRELAVSTYFGSSVKLIDPTDGVVLWSRRVSQLSDFVPGRFAATPDADDDGVPDLLVGTTPFGGVGEARLISGRTGEVLFLYHGEHPRDEFGASVASWQENGANYIAIGAPRTVVDGLFAVGRVYVYRLPRSSDVNGDGCVNQADVDRIRGAWNTTDLTADVNGDGIVNDRDLARVLGRFGRGCDEKK